MGDAQITAEYIAYAIPYLVRRALHSLPSLPFTKPSLCTQAKQSATGQMSIVGHSQGAGLNPQWALLFWPSTRAYVEDYVGLAADFHGTAEGPLACVALDLLEGGCEASCVPPFSFSPSCLFFSLSLYLCFYVMWKQDPAADRRVALSRGAEQQGERGVCDNDEHLHHL